jgi:hypothetical protein
MNRDKTRAELDDMTRRLQFINTHLPDAINRLHGAANGDGYPSGTSNTGGGTTTSDTTPVERAALRRAEHGQHDHAAADLRRIANQLARAAQAVWRLQQSTARYVPAAPLTTAPVCGRCHKVTTSSIRRGMCAACYQAWHRTRGEGASA